MSGHGGGVESGVGYFIRIMLDAADPKNWEVYRKSTGDGDSGGGHH